MCRTIVRQARTGLYTARMLRDDYSLPVTVRRVHIILTDVETLKKRPY